MGKTIDELEEDLKPDHLLESLGGSTEELKQEIEGAEKAGEGTPDLDNPRLQKEYEFDFSWKDGRGKVWAGKFTNKILSIKQQQGVGVMRARFAGDTPVNAQDGFTAELNLMLAHMSFSLTKRPTWAEDLRELDNHRILQELYTEVMAHEASFFGY